MADEPHRIDVHHHIVPPRYLEVARDAVVGQSLGKPGALTQILEWTPERSLEIMDRNGIATAIGSVSAPGLWFGDIAATRDLARACNEYGVELAVRHPGRFGLFAVLPLPDCDASLREVEYALDELGADGICLMSNVDDRWLGDDAFAPVLEELDRRQAVVFVHPTVPSACRNIMPGLIPALIEFPTDTTRTITSLLFSGTLSRLPHIRFIFSHGGGTMTVLASRLASLAAREPELAERIPNGVGHELRKLYFEVASFANTTAMAALMDLVPTSQILFGSDYAYIRAEVAVEGLAGLGLTRDDARAIDRDNAARLLQRGD